MRCRTPAQKRRRDFHTREDWVAWAIRVARSNSGMVIVNRRSWRTSQRDMDRACNYAIKLGMMYREARQRPEATVYRLVPKEARDE
jgi:hypothetical protein